MGKQKGHYTKEFKLEAIRLHENGSQSVREVEQDLGITAGLLNKWRRRHRADGQEAFVGRGHHSELATEVRWLKGENEILRQARDLLKKALVVF